jgi:hypothetical protein
MGSFKDLRWGYVSCLSRYQIATTKTLFQDPSVRSWGYVLCFSRYHWYILSNPPYYVTTIEIWALGRTVLGGGGEVGGRGWRQRSVEYALQPFGNVKTQRWVDNHRRWRRSSCSHRGSQQWRVSSTSLWTRTSFSRSSKSKVQTLPARGVLWYPQVNNSHLFSFI